LVRGLGILANQSFGQAAADAGGLVAYVDLANGGEVLL
jgi:hypothetical protein